MWRLWWLRMGVFRCGKFAGVEGAGEVVACSESTDGVLIFVSVLFSPFGMDEPLGAPLSSPDPDASAAAMNGKSLAR
jgi:hypothetical protein